MRAVLLTNFIPPYRVTLYQELAKRFASLDVLISTPMEPNRDWKPDWSGLRVTLQRTFTFRQAWRHPHGFAEPIWVHVPLDTLPLLYRLRPDVVLSAEMGPRTLQATLYARTRSRTGLVLWATVSEHSEQGRGRIREQLRRLLLQQADAVIVNGESGARYVAARGAGPERVFRAPYTTDMTALQALPLERTGNTAHRLLYIGQLTERKGILPFVQCLSEYATREGNRLIELDIAGTGPLETKLRQVPTPSNLKISFLGSVDYESLPNVYGRAGILAFPTLADEWGLVVNEAMAAGIPVLGSRNSQAVEELVLDGRTGWQFSPNDRGDMSTALERALTTQPTELASMRHRTRLRVASVTAANTAAKVFDAAEYAVLTRR